MSGDEVPRAHPTQLLAQQRGVEQLRGLAKPYRFRVEADAGDSPSNPRPRALAGLGEDGQGIFVPAPGQAITPRLWDVSFEVTEGSRPWL